MDAFCRRHERCVLHWAEIQTVFGSTGDMFSEHKYYTSVYHWCGLGVRDYDSSCSPARHTRISSTRSLPSHACQCENLGAHVCQPRVERRPDEIQRGESAPHQRASQDWVKSLISLLELKRNGPFIPQKVKPRKDEPC